MSVTQPPKSSSSALAATASSSSRKKTPKTTTSSSSTASGGAASGSGSSSPGQGGTASSSGASNFSNTTTTTGASGTSVKRHPSPSPAIRRVPSPSPMSIPITVTAAAAARGTSPPRMTSSTKRGQSPPQRRPGGLRKAPSTNTTITNTLSTVTMPSSSSSASSSSLAATAPINSNRKVAFNSAVTVKKMPSSNGKTGQSGSVKRDSNIQSTTAGGSGSGHDDDSDDDLRPTPRDDAPSNNNNNNSNRDTDITTAPLSDAASRPLQSFSDGKDSPPQSRRVPGSAAIVIRVLEDDDDKEQTLTTEQAVKMLRTGREVNIYDGMTGQKRVVNAWYEPPVIGQDGLGSFYWTLAGSGRGREQWPDQSLPLATLTDMTLGKDHIEFRRMASAIHAPDNCCFSLVSPNGAWHIHEKASWRADAWVEAVQYLLRSAGSLVITEAEALEERSRGQHARKYSFAAVRYFQLLSSTTVPSSHCLTCLVVQCIASCINSASRIGSSSLYVYGT
jgi:hypothetical protein